MSLTGTLGIEISRTPGLLANVRFSSPRAVPVERLLSGIEWRQAAKRAASLFAICGKAHAIALTLACEAAEQRPVRPAATLARQVLTAAEALGEHGMRILIDWPRFLGLEPDAPALRPVLAGMRGLSTVAGPDAVFYGAGDEAALLAEAYSFGALARPAILPRGQELANQLVERLGATLVSDSGTDMTVLGRRLGDPRLEGEGLARRIRARLLELEMLCDWLAGPKLATAPLIQSAMNNGPGSGLSIVEVARGRLTHRVTLEAGKIAALSISAPTSENFAVGGVADRVIRSLPAASHEAFEWQARLAIMEIDPCVAHDIRIV